MQGIKVVFGEDPHGKIYVGLDGKGILVPVCIGNMAVHNGKKVTFFYGDKPDVHLFVVMQTLLALDIRWRYAKMSHAFTLWTKPHVK